MTPACGHCSGQQRWVAQNAAWYCDRCQAWMQHSQPLGAMTRRPGNSRAPTRKAWLTPAAIGVVVAFATLALILAMGGDDQRGLSSPSELGDAVVKAAVGGDVDRLVALSTVSVFPKIMDCQHEPDFKIFRLFLKRATRRAKGFRHEPIAGVEKSGDLRRFGKGERLDDCEIKQDYLQQSFQIVDRQGDVIASMDALQVGGQWYLMGVQDMGERELTDEEREEERKEWAEIERRIEAHKKLTSNEE